MPRRTQGQPGQEFCGEFGNQKDDPVLHNCLNKSRVAWFARVNNKAQDQDTSIAVLTIPGRARVASFLDDTFEDCPIPGVAVKIAELNGTTIIGEPTSDTNNFDIRVYHIARHPRLVRHVRRAEVELHAKVKNETIDRLHIRRTGATENRSKLDCSPTLDEKGKRRAHYFDVREGGLSRECGKALDEFHEHIFVQLSTRIEVELDQT